jgi:hypothetical protein
MLDSLGIAKKHLLQARVPYPRGTTFTSESNYTYDAGNRITQVQEKNAGGTVTARSREPMMGSTASRRK